MSNPFAQALQFVINVQHDCNAAGCDATGIIRQLQERQESNKTVRSIIHKDNQLFVINTHAIHNGTLLRCFLPRYLTVPQHLFPDRRKRLDGLGAQTQVQMTAKKAATQAKAALTRQKNNEAQAEAEERNGGNSTQAAKRKQS